MVVSLVHRGTLLVLGTDAEPITITAVEPSPGRWVDCRQHQQQPANIKLDHVIIEYGGFTTFGEAANLQLRSAVADIDHSIFRNGRHYRISVDFNTRANVRNSSFTGNGAGALINYFNNPLFDMGGVSLSQRQRRLQCGCV